VANGDGGESPIICWARTAVKQITKFTDLVRLARLGRDNALIWLSRAARRVGKVLRLPLETPDLARRIEIVSGSGCSNPRHRAGNKCALCVDLLGRALPDAALQNWTGAAGRRFQCRQSPTSRRTWRWKNGALLYRDVSYTEPAAWFEVAPGQLESTKTALAQHLAGFLSDIEVTREFAPSTNGTKVPLNIIRRKGTKLDGSNPTLLYGRWLRSQHVADLRL